MKIGILLGQTKRLILVGDLSKNNGKFKTAIEKFICNGGKVETETLNVLTSMTSYSVEHTIRGCKSFSRSQRKNFSHFSYLLNLMCGRLACSLKPREVCISCCYREPGTDQYKTPLWKDCFNSGKTYKPSYNVCPTEVAPVLLSGSHFQLESRLVLPMVFGVIPHWTKTNVNKYSTINCRIETIQSSKLYGNLLEKNQRCVVICNGFYEWQKQSNSKKPFFIHSKQENEIKINNPNSWNLEFTPEEGFHGFKSLKLAALFQMNSFQTLEEATFNFTIITKEARSETSWLHERVPAILETDEQLDMWLNCKEVGGQLALASLTHSYQLECFPVSKLVNSTANKDISCIQKEKDSGERSGNKSSVSFLKDWLEKGQKRKGSKMSGDGNTVTKKKAL